MSSDANLDSESMSASAQSLYALSKEPELENAEVTHTLINLVHDGRKNKIQMFPRKMSFFPINLLPVEVLAQIFLLLSRLPEPPNITRSTPWWDWLILTKICRHWRNIMLGYPVIWTEIIHFRRVDKIQAFLKRSKQADISVTIGKDGDNHISLSALEALGKDIYRVRDLNIVTSSMDVHEWTIVQKILMGSVSPLRLKELSLHIFDTYHTGTRIQSVRLNLLENSDCSSLENISLHGASLRWSSPILRGLTRLSLLAINDIDSCPTVSELLDILKSCPRILTLELDSVGPKPEHSTSIQQRLISLQDLEYIRLRGFDADVCTTFLSYLQFPKDRDIVWDITCDNYPFGDPPSSQTFIPNLLNNNAKSSCVQIILEDENLLINADRGRSRLYRYCCSSHLTLKWEMYPDWETDHDDDHDHLPLAQLVNTGLLSVKAMLECNFYKDATIELLVCLESIDAIYAISEMTWMTLFGSIGSRMLELSVTFPSKIRDDDHRNAPEKRFIAALTRPIVSQHVHEIDKCIAEEHACPKLLKLDISFADFNFARGRELYKMLVEYLQCHSREHTALSSLRLHRCGGINEEDIDELKNLNIANDIIFTPTLSRGV